MKKLILTLAACTAASAALAQTESADSVKKGFEFTDVKVIPTTSVKDQNKSGTCWSFSGTSFLEDEVRRLGGDSLDLSEMYTVRYCYDDKADRYIRLYGECNFSQGGGLLDVGYVLKKYGMVPEDAYPGLNYGEEKHDHYEMATVMESMLKAVVKKPSKKISTAWRRALNGVLDAYMGEVPTEFTYKGKKYTPKSFAESLPVNPDDYVALTSFTHHPFYETFMLEVPDNWLYGQYMNVPLDELKAIADYAVENGFPINWAADVSEGGFKWNKGVALMPKGKTQGDMNGTELARWVKLSDRERANDKYNFDGPVEEEVITQESRQKGFDSQETTDDHGMEIVGYATDQNGKRYYKVKNSWDTNQVYDGFLYVSEPYFLAKTVSMLVHKDAIPKHIAKKIGLKK
ncbi:MAG: C1 family peptidase [Bacteroidales bacterium]|nr:C1 family peptidase [Bacteroidales bacterium]MDD6722701.1 C1 family peptidase [Bacteroidales bacterium]